MTKLHIYLCDKQEIKNSEEGIRMFGKEYAEDTGVYGGQDWVATTPILRTPKGKPYFSDHYGIHFSLSHSGSVWGCAFDTAPVGFDLEDMTRLRVKKSKEAESGKEQRWCRIARRFFTPKECEYVMAGGEEAFFRLWVRKEAYLKYKGTGLSTGLSDVSLVEEGNLLSRLPDGWALGLSLGTGLEAAYCAAEERVVEKIIDYRKSKK